MSALEQPFKDAIAAKRIEGVVLEGRERSGKVYSQAFGERTLLDGSTRPLAKTDILFLASATKLLTSISVLQCCERGELSLDADLAPALPEMISQGVMLGYDESDNSPITEPLRKPLTLRHLLTHSSGLIYDNLNPDMSRWRAAHPLPKLDQGVASRFGQPLAFQPGEGWMYGPGLDWAGVMVEKATGVRLDEYFRKHIFEPLGVPATEMSFFPVGEGMSERMPDVNPKDPDGDGLSASMGFKAHSDGLVTCFGGSGGYATADAYIAVLQSLLVDDRKLLTSESVAEMFRPQLEPAASRALAATLDSPSGNLFAQNIVGPNRDFGLGGILNGDDESAGFGKGAMTWGGGINTAWLIDPKNGVCGFASPQLGIPGDREIATELKRIFRKELKGQLNGGQLLK